jgi:ABC-type lipoprotein export system ATPase subunit
VTDTAAPARIGQYVLEVENLKKSYISPDGEHTQILDIPGFHVGYQEQVAMRGPSGSGKTTLLNIIAGILAPDSGRVSIAGVDTTNLSEAARDRNRAKNLGYVFQTFNLLHGYSALENVLLGMMFGRGSDTAVAQSLLERVGLGSRLKHRPSQLSVGQQQRVAVARALANHPQLVLADEPTGNLDRRHGQEALTLIRDVCRDQGAALLLVSHDPEVLGAFERVEDLSVINRAADVAPAASLPVAR